MGYYSRIEWTISVKKEQIETLRAKIKELLDKPDADQPEFVYYFLKSPDSVEINDYGEIMWEEREQKFYDDLGFAKFIAPYVTEGWIEFTGQDGLRYGYEFDGKGKVWHLEYVCKRGKEIR